MSDLATTNCGCGCDDVRGNNNNCGCFGNNSIIWIIILLCCFGNNGWGSNGCGNNGCGFGGCDNCCIIIILLLLCGSNGCGFCGCN